MDLSALNGLTARVINMLLLIVEHHSRLCNLENPDSTSTVTGADYGDRANGNDIHVVDIVRQWTTRLLRIKCTAPQSSQPVRRHVTEVITNDALCNLSISCVERQDQR